MSDFYFFITPEWHDEWEDERIDKALSGLIDFLSRSYIQKLLKDGQVKVNQLPVKANYRLKYGDEIRLQAPDAVEPNIVPKYSFRYPL